MNRPVQAYPPCNAEPLDLVGATRRMEAEGVVHDLDRRCRSGRTVAIVPTSCMSRRTMLELLRRAIATRSVAPVCPRAVPEMS